MDNVNTTQSNRFRVWLSQRDGSVEDLKLLCERTTVASDCPLADDIQQNVPIYDAADIENFTATDRKALLAEWATIFASGPGIIVVRQAIPNAAVLDRATELFADIIVKEKNVSAKGDYFAAPGANDRVWNSLQKHCLQDPTNFADYFSYRTIDLACTAWLGPGYQATAQVHRVNPGGKAQHAHRDFHLGFMTPERQESYPGLLWRLSRHKRAAAGGLPR